MNVTNYGTSGSMNTSPSGKKKPFAEDQKKLNKEAKTAKAAKESLEKNPSEKSKYRRKDYEVIRDKETSQEVTKQGEKAKLFRK